MTAVSGAGANCSTPVSLTKLASAAAEVWRHDDPDMEDEIQSVRRVVLHVIEETACHSVHLDIARELLDGRTNLGLR